MFLRLPHIFHSLSYKDDHFKNQQKQYYPCQLLNYQFDVHRLFVEIFQKVAIPQLIENAGWKLLFLPPYSPNLNPIEHFWFAIKHNIRKILPNYWPNIKKDIDFVFQDMSKHYCS
uniref:transposase n=1 Tax=Spiroplasma ixodetis TaxID=2141 RepID=UPI003EC12A68